MTTANDTGGNTACGARGEHQWIALDLATATGQDEWKCVKCGLRVLR